MELTTRDVRHLARLARLQPADGPAEGWAGALKEMLAYVHQLSVVEPETTDRSVAAEGLAEGLPVAVQELETTAEVGGVRADEPGTCLPAAVVLANAPAHNKGWVMVAPPAGHARASVEAARDGGGEAA